MGTLTVTQWLGVSVLMVQLRATGYPLRCCLIASVPDRPEGKRRSEVGSVSHSSSHSCAHLSDHAESRVKRFSSRGLTALYKSEFISKIFLLLVLESIS